MKISRKQKSIKFDSNMVCIVHVCNFLAYVRLLGVGLYFVRITHLRFDEKHATPDLTNPWQGSTKTPASVLHLLSGGHRYTTS
jgi:hypothetical protein